MNMVTCPHCGGEVEISQAFKHQIKEEVAAEYKRTQAKELEKQKEIIKKETEDRLKKEFEFKFKNSQNESEENKKKLEQFQNQLLEANKLNRQLKDKDKERELEMQKKLAAEEDKIRIDAQKKAEEEQHLKMAAKDKQLQDTLKELEDARRKLQQGSQQSQGEVFELEFEALLQKEFPHDKIKPVGKGIKGGDIIQEVWDSRGNYNGKILWELKNTKTWGGDWVDKLKLNKRAINAEEAVLITEVMPGEMKTAGYKDGVWVTKQQFVVGLASALRASLIQLYYVRTSAKGKDEKVELLYSYLSGIEFKHRIEAIVEAFTKLQSNIEKEKRYFAGKWASDEKHIRQVIDSTYGMHGDFRGIMGNNLQTIKGLEIKDEEQGSLLE